MQHSSLKGSEMLNPTDRVNPDRVGAWTSCLLAQDQQHELHAAVLGGTLIEQEADTPEVPFGLLAAAIPVASS
jgi:hypothetical protein